MPRKRRVRNHVAGEVCHFVHSLDDWHARLRDRLDLVVIAALPQQLSNRFDRFDTRRSALAIVPVTTLLIRKCDAQIDVCGAHAEARGSRTEWCHARLWEAGAEQLLHAAPHLLIAFEVARMSKFRLMTHVLKEFIERRRGCLALEVHHPLVLDLGNGTDFESHRLRLQKRLELARYRGWLGDDGRDLAHLERPFAERGGDVVEPHNGGVGHGLRMWSDFRRHECETTTRRKKWVRIGREHRHAGPVWRQARVLRAQMLHPLPRLPRPRPWLDGQGDVRVKYM